MLSRGLSQLVSKNNFKIIKAGRDVMVPSHAWYVHDIMLFTRGCINSLDAISGLFTKYAGCFGQVCHPSKSILFDSFMPAARHSLLANRTVFLMGQMPFSYLVSQGKKSNVFHVQNITQSSPNFIY